jgi:hypothetical protein
MAHVLRPRLSAGRLITSLQAESLRIKAFLIDMGLLRGGGMLYVRMLCEFKMKPSTLSL